MMQPGMPQSHPGMGGMQQQMGGMNPSMMQNMQALQQQQQQQQQAQIPMQPDPTNHYLRAAQVLPLHQPLTYDLAVQYLLKAVSIAQTTPFQWLPIDKPSDNDLYLIYHTNAPSVPWANDGLRYLDSTESSFRANIQGHELEVKETKYGFIPGVGENQASRVRRKFRLLKGGSPHLWLIHYTRGQGQPVPPIFQNPQRKYPIPPAPPGTVWVLNPPRPGQPIPHSPAQQIPGRTPQKDMQRAMLLAHQQQQSLQQQHHTQTQQQQSLQQQQQQQQQAHAQQQQQQQQQRAQMQHQKLEEDSDDEPEWLTRRDLARARFVRNSEFMQDVFAFPGKLPDPAADPWSNATPESLTAHLQKLESEIQAAQQTLEQRTNMLKSRRRDAEMEAEGEREMEREGVRGEGEGEVGDVSVAASLSVSAPGGGAAAGGLGVPSVLAAPPSAAGTPAPQATIAAAEHPRAEPTGQTPTIQTPEAQAAHQAAEEAAAPHPSEGEEVDMDDADGDADGDAEDAEGDADADEAGGEEGEGEDQDMEEPTQDGQKSSATPTAHQQQPAEAGSTSEARPRSANSARSSSNNTPAAGGANNAPKSPAPPVTGDITVPEPTAGPAAAGGEKEAVQGVVPERAEEDPHEVRDGPVMPDEEMGAAGQDGDGEE